MMPLLRCPLHPELTMEFQSERSYFDKTGLFAHQRLYFACPTCKGSFMVERPFVPWSVMDGVVKPALDAIARRGESR